MYQEIDDPEWEEHKAKDRKRALLLTLCLSLILILILGSLWFVFRSGPQKPAIIDNSTEVTAQYRTALSEPSPPLRRARLLDYLETYPDTPIVTTIRAQLSVLNAAESKSWAALTDAVYNPALTDAEKLEAIEAYIRDWGPVYLGEREDEITAFMQDLVVKTPLETTEDNPEEKSFTSEDFAAPDPNYSTTLSDTVMAGGITRRAQDSIQAPAPRPIRREIAKSIIPPKIRRNVTPRYPKSAQRRGVEGLVTAALNINAEGRVDMVTIVSVESDRYAKDFAKAAKRAARRTRFFPQTVNGVPTPVSGVIKRYRFEIENE